MPPGLTGFLTTCLCILEPGRAPSHRVPRVNRVPRVGVAAEPPVFKSGVPATVGATAEHKGDETSPTPRRKSKGTISRNHQSPVFSRHLAISIGTPLLFLLEIPKSADLHNFLLAERCCPQSLGTLVIITSLPVAFEIVGGYLAGNWKMRVSLHFFVSMVLQPSPLKARAPSRFWLERTGATGCRPG